MLKSKNVLRMLTRGTSAHTRNSSRFTIHCLAAVPCLLLRNTLGSLTRQWISDYAVFNARQNMLLVHAWSMFLIFVNFIENHPVGKKCLGHWPEPHFRRAHASAAFKMLLWLMTLCKTRTPAAGCWRDCLQNQCETHINSCCVHENITCHVISLPYHTSQLAIQCSFMLKNTAYLYICMHMLAYVCIRMQMYAYACVCVCVHTYAYVCICARMYGYVCKYACLPNLPQSYLIPPL